MCFDPYIYHTFQLFAPKCGAQNHDRNERLNRFLQILIANEYDAISSHSITSTKVVINTNAVHYE